MFKSPEIKKETDTHIIVVTGFSCSGKTTYSRNILTKIIPQFRGLWCDIIIRDRFDRCFEIYKNKCDGKIIDEFIDYIRKSISTTMPTIIEGAFRDLSILGRILEGHQNYTIINLIPSKLSYASFIEKRDKLWVLKDDNRYKQMWAEYEELKKKFNNVKLVAPYSLEPYSNFNKLL